MKRIKKNIFKAIFSNIHMKITEVIILFLLIFFLCIRKNSSIEYI